MFIYSLNTLEETIKSPKNCEVKGNNKILRTFFNMKRFSRIVGNLSFLVRFLFLENLPVVYHSLTIRPFSKCCNFPICYMTKKLCGWYIRKVSNIYTK